MVTLLEKTSHYRQRPRPELAPWGLPPLGRMKPKNLTVNELVNGTPVAARFVAATTRFNFKNGEPEGIIIIVSCFAEGKRYSFLFGVAGEHYAEIVQLKTGDPVSLERSGEEILVNRIPVRKFYRRTMDGVLELAGSGWKKLTGNG